MANAQSACRLHVARLGLIRLSDHHRHFLWRNIGHVWDKHKHLSLGKVQVHSSLFKQALRVGNKRFIRNGCYLVRRNVIGQQVLCNADTHRGTQVYVEMTLVIGLLTVVQYLVVKRSTESQCTKHVIDGGIGVRVI